MECHKPKIIFIVKSRVDSYGVSIGLINSAQFNVNYLKAHGYDCKLIKVVDANDIDRIVTNEKPDIAFVEALFVTPQKFKEIIEIPRHKSVKWIVRLHSKAPFLSNESQAFDWLFQYKEMQKKYPNLVISSNSKEFTSDLEDVMVAEIKYLPNIYYPDIKRRKSSKGKHKSQYIDISCFGAIRLLKNQLSQAMAAILFARSIGKKLRFHINSSRIEGRSEPTLANLRSLFKGVEDAELVEWNWMTHKDFLKVIGKMDLSMQVSFTESFNIVSADAVHENVPSIFSLDIDWSPRVYRAEPSDIRDIVSKLHSAWKHPSLNRFLNSLALEGYNEKSCKVWKEFLKKYETKI